jgi:hypothetical protein
MPTPFLRNLASAAVPPSVIVSALKLASTADQLLISVTDTAAVRATLGDL